VFARGHKALGVQLFSVPKMLADDFPGTLAFLAGLGYTEVEFFGPYDFSTSAAIAWWKSVEPQLGFSGSGFYGAPRNRTDTLLRAADFESAWRVSIRCRDLLKRGRF
jgi:hypothetical protein